MPRIHFHRRAGRVARSSLAAMLLAGASVLALASSGAAAAAPEIAAPAPLDDWDATFARAMEMAAAQGRLSVLASVIENVRRAPVHAARIEAAARAALPAAPDAVARASAVGLRLAGEEERLAALPPGADPAVPAATLGETEANYGWSMIGAEAAARLGLGGAGVTVGIVDSGIAQRLDGSVHPEFEGRIDPRSFSYLHWIDTTVTLEELQADPQAAADRLFDREAANGFDDVHGHGTHVAGIVGAAQDGRGMVGVAPLANILSVGAIPTDGGLGELPYYLLQFCGRTFLTSNGASCDPKSGDEQDPTIHAMRYLTQQADVRVTNGSFGPVPEPGAQTVAVGGASANLDALSDYVMAGKIWVAAAGNGYIDAPVQSESADGLALAPFIAPENAGATNSAGVPVFDDGGEGLDYSHLHPDRLAAREAETGEAYGRIVAVVAVGADKAIASYSNRCGVTARWCLAAPGGDVARDDEGNPVERPIYSTVPQDVADREAGLGAGEAAPYGFSAGTSMAAPHVAGALAILIEAYPDFAPGHIVDILFSTAEDLGAPGLDEIYGWGLLRLDRALDGPVGIASQSTDVYEADVADRQVWRFDFASQGSLLKTGQGVLQTAAGTSIGFAGEAAVAEGAFQVDGRFAASRLFVASGAVLAGSGLIAADVGVAGELSPGGSTGTLTVAGTVGLLDGATTTIEIDGATPGAGPGGFDRVVALADLDAFTAAGVLAPRLRGIAGAATNAFVPALGQSFDVVLTPNGAIAGSFSAIDQPAAGLAEGTRFDALYGRQVLSLVATPLDYGDLARAGVVADDAAAAVGRALQERRPEAGVRPDEAAAAVFDPLYRLDADRLAGALSTAAGTVQVDMAQESLLAIGRYSDTLAARRIGGRAPGGRSAWLAPVLGGVEVGQGGEGYEAVHRGVAAGAEGETEIAGRTVFLGLSGAYGRSALDDAGGTADVDVYQGGVYGAVERDGVVLSAAAGLAFASGEAVRSGALGTTTGGFEAFGGFADLTVSLPTAVSSGTVTPFAGLGYRGLSRRSERETGAMALDVAGQGTDQAFATVGAEFAGAFAAGALRLEPTASLAYRYDLDAIDWTGAHAVLDAPFEASGARIGRHAFVGSVGLAAALSETVSVSASYQTEVRSGLQTHGGRIGLTARW